MEKIVGYGYTSGQQGGIGYPPLVVKYRGKWYEVEDSRSHGGTVCGSCSRSRGIEMGYIPQKFEQPKPFGSACYRSLIQKPAVITPKFLPKRKMSWDVFAQIVKNQYGEPPILTGQKR